MTASHHRWPMKPPPEPVAIVRPAPAQTRYVDLKVAKGDRPILPRAQAFQQVRSSVQGTYVRSSKRSLAAISALSPALKRRGERESSELLRRGQPARAKRSQTETQRRRSETCG